jgi:hypothetical protein
MRHTNYLLKPLTIDNAKLRDKAYALTDGGGLLLEVLPSGTKTWRFKYHLNGKREKVTIGAYPAYTIKQARDRHEELRALVERGESPAKTKQSSMAARKVAESRDLTVRVFARRWIDETLFYRSPAYVAQIVRWLDAYIDPAIGDMQLADVQRVSRRRLSPSARAAAGTLAGDAASGSAGVARTTRSPVATAAASRVVRRQRPWHALARIAAKSHSCRACGIHPCACVHSGRIPHRARCSAPFGSISRGPHS